MSGCTSTTFSPSRVTTMRNTPWVLGCWGPMFSMSSSVRRATIQNPPSRIRTAGVPTNSPFEFVGWRLRLCGCGSGSRDPPAQERFLFDLVLELQEALDQRLRPRGATRHVDVHRDHLVDALQDRVVIVIERPPTGRARTHGNHVLWLGHLFPQTTHDRRALDRGPPGPADAVGLPGTGPGDDAHTVHVEAGRIGLHHFDGTAGQPEGQRPQRRGPPPVQDFLYLGENHTPARQRVDDLPRLVEWH